ncbi:MAG: gas vesicle protein GvpO [Ignavibacteria bacterium]|jgi:hypothetical protein
MHNITSVSNAAAEFLKQNFNVDSANVIKAKKVGNAWEVVAEVFEDSSFIKSLGLPSKVKDRNFYLVQMNDNLEVESYERIERSDKE